MKFLPFSKVTVAALMSALSMTAAQAAPNVVASIKPVHALVSTVMQGIGTPHLIVDGAASPHTFSLRPSSAKALSEADIVVWLGPQLETFLTGSIETLAENATVLNLSTTPDLILLDQREGGAFDSHEHDDDTHEEGEEHDHEDEHHDHEDEKHDDHENGHAHDESHDNEDDHAHDEADLHVWLDPQNAKVMLTAIAHRLGDADPENARTYAQNANRAIAGLDELVLQIAAKLEPVSQKPFIVFHDAYQYFEKRFDLQAAGSITVSPDAIPGVQRIAEIRQKIEQSGAVCVFAEPQFEPRLVSVVIEGTQAKAGILDPLGAELENGTNLYAELLNGLANSFVDCLADE